MSSPGASLVPGHSHAQDLAACRALLAAGSKSFAAASLLLPARMRDDAAAVYAFCRVADDAVDEGSDPQQGVEQMQARLENIYLEQPIEHPVDRAFERVVKSRGIPLYVVRDTP